MKLEDLKPVRAFAKSYPDLTTESGLRWAIFKRDENGLSRAGALVRIGRRIYIDVPKFTAWVEAQQRRAA